MFWLGKVETFSEPSAAARLGQTRGVTWKRLNTEMSQNNGLIKLI